MPSSKRVPNIFIGDDELLIKLIEAHRMAVEQGHKRLAVVIEMAIVERQGQID